MIKLLKKGINVLKSDKHFSVGPRFQTRNRTQCSCNC